jgi:hypothetical protein
MRRSLPWTAHILGNPEFVQGQPIIGMESKRTMVSCSASERIWAAVPLVWLLRDYRYCCHCWRSDVGDSRKSFQSRTLWERNGPQGGVARLGFRSVCEAAQGLVCSPWVTRAGAFTSLPPRLKGPFTDSGPSSPGAGQGLRARLVIV